MALAGRYTHLVLIKSLWPAVDALQLAHLALDRRGTIVQLRGELLLQDDLRLQVRQLLPQLSHLSCRGGRHPNEPPGEKTTRPQTGGMRQTAGGSDEQATNTNSKQVTYSPAAHCSSSSQTARTGPRVRCDPPLPTSTRRVGTCERPWQAGRPTQLNDPTADANRWSRTATATATATGGGGGGEGRVGG